MDTKYITKTALAQANGVSAAYISKLVKKGIFDSCLENGKLLRDLALQTYLEIKDPTRDSQREANRTKKISHGKKANPKKVEKENWTVHTPKEGMEIIKKKIFKEVVEVASEVIEEDDNNINTYTQKGIINSDLYNQDNLKELKSLLYYVKSSNQKVQIIKDFWTGKINEQKFLEGEKLLIPKEQIIKDVQRILKAFRDKTLSLPTKMSSELVGLKDKKEVASVVESYCYELLEELSSLEDIE